MLDRLLPSGEFRTIYDITPAFLTEQGIKALILDIDNTLVTYDDPKPTEPVLRWLEEMHAAGIRTAFVSNNHAPRVETFCEGLGCYYHADSHKPSVRWLREAMAHMNTSPENTASIGDQLFTDVWAAGRAGMRSYFVPPIKDKTTLFFRFKRLLEKPLHRVYRKRCAHPDKP